MSHPKRRLLGVPAAAATAVLTAALLVPVALVVASPAAAVEGECPTSTLPGPAPAPAPWTDDNVAVYAGGDFTATGSAAEVEGLLVVAGDATIAREVGGTTFNVGSVGVGSGVSPTPGEVMFAVGGDLTVVSPAELHVGALSDDGAGSTGGDVWVGGGTAPVYTPADPGAGDFDDAPTYQFYGGALTDGLGAGAVARWASWGDVISTQSAQFAAMTAVPAEMNAPFLDFVGSGANPQVFSVTAEQLETHQAIRFSGIPDGTPVIVNVVGGADGIVWEPNYFGDDGDQVDGPTSPGFGAVAQRTMWNFVDATSVHVAGTSQVLGSILVPGVNPDPTAPTLRVTAHTNGRVYTNGSILMDGTAGNEMHNYPWLAPGVFACIAQQGTFVVAKLVEGAGAPDVVFTGTWSCADDGVVVASGTWSTTAGGRTGAITAPLGASCTIAEDASAPSPGGAWTSTDITPNPVVIADGAEPALVQVTNTWTPTAVQQSGAFEILKTVAGEGAPAVSFTGSWSCAVEGGVPLTGTWTARAGQTAGPFRAPVGAECSVTEAQPAGTAAGQWAEPVIGGAPAVITAASADIPIRVTVANTWRPTSGASTPTSTPTPTAGAVGPALPATGGTLPWWAIPVGGGLVIAGAVAVATALVPRRRS